MLTSRCRVMLITAIALMTLLALSPHALAQAQPTSTAATDQASSFADVFFITWQLNADGTRSVEWIGSLMIWFLILLSVLNIGLIGNLALTNQRKGVIPNGVVAQVRQMMAAGRYKECIELADREKSYFSAVLAAALKEASHGYGAVVRALERTADELTVRRLRRIEYLNVLGQVSPMIGLFGTVYGMIMAFMAIVSSGGNADPTQLAAGIGTALVTTFWGLLIAIPALAAYAMIRNKIDELTTEATLAAEEVVNQFRPKQSSKSSGPSPAPEPTAAASH